MFLRHKPKGGKSIIRRGVELTANLSRMHAFVPKQDLPEAANNEACMIRRDTQLTAGSHIHASEFE